jgi:hypothetical protein
VEGKTVGGLLPGVRVKVLSTIMGWDKMEPKIGNGKKGKTYSIH